MESGPMALFTVKGNWSGLSRPSPAPIRHAARRGVRLVCHLLEFVLLGAVVVASSQCVWHGSALSLFSHAEDSGNTFPATAWLERRQMVAAVNEVVSRPVLDRRLGGSVPDAVREAAYGERGDRLELLLKGGFIAQPDSRMPFPSAHRPQAMVYAFECAVESTIEERDGGGYTELLRVDRLRQAKLHTTATCPEIRFGAFDRPFLGGLAAPQPEEGIVVLPAGPVSQALFGLAGEQVGRHPDSHACLSDDDLTGKCVRVQYRSGRGIVSLQPVGCTLTRAEAQTLLTLAASLPSWRSARDWDEQAIDQAGLASLLMGPQFHMSLAGHDESHAKPRLKQGTRHCDNEGSAGHGPSAAVASDPMVRPGQSIRLGGVVVRDMSGQFVLRAVETSDDPASAPIVRSGRLRGSLLLPFVARDRLLHEHHFRVISEFVMTYACRTSA